jgi:hypothetical protein
MKRGRKEVRGAPTYPSKRKTFAERVLDCPNNNKLVQRCVVGAVRSRKNESQMRIEDEKK